MITLENEGTTFHPLGLLLFSEVVWHQIEAREVFCTLSIFSGH